MNFGAILDEWDRRPQAATAASGKDEVEEKAGPPPGERRRRLLRKKSDAEIDLHGLTKEEAWNALDVFFQDGRRRGLEKLLIIHGKGNHSGGDAALKALSRQFIEQCPFAGESGHENAAAGGSGATWVLLKDTSAPGR